MILAYPGPTCLLPKQLNLVSKILLYSQPLRLHIFKFLNYFIFFSLCRQMKKKKKKKKPIPILTENNHNGKERTVFYLPPTAQYILLKTFLFWKLQKKSFGKIPISVIKAFSLLVLLVCSNLTTEGSLPYKLMISCSWIIPNGLNCIVWYWEICKTLSYEMLALKLQSYLSNFNDTTNTTQTIPKPDR